MADDIVTRLRYAARTCNHGFPNGAGDSFPDPTACGGCMRLAYAADEIERLTEWRKNALLALDKREAEIRRLRAAGDALAEALHAWINGMDAFTDDRSRIHFRADEMHGAAGDLDARAQHFRMHVEAFEGGKKGRMNVDQTPVPLIDEVGGQEAHEPREADKIGACRLQRPGQLRLKFPFAVSAFAE